jgi:hypothetical protein
MFEPMLAADPSFALRWAAFEAEWADEAQPPLYLALSSLAEHILERLARGKTEGFDRIFAVVERWHIEGDSYVSEAASIGLLESLQNQLGGNDRNVRRADGVSAAAVEPWLGPESRRWWEKLYSYWDGDTAALRFDT